MQVGLNQNSLKELFSVVKNFTLQIHHRIEQNQQLPVIEPHILNIIDRSSAKIKELKKNIQVLELQLKEAQVAKISFKQLRNECTHLDRRLTQKSDQISILRETVKTLYQDNERISGEKQAMSKEIASLKESSSGLKKRLKRQQDDILNHKNQLKKLTIATQDKLGEYLKQDQHKQAIIKKQGSDIDRLKSDLNKKEKSINTKNQKLEELKNSEINCEKMMKLVQTLKEENSLLLTEVQHGKEKHLEEKGKWLKETDTLKHTIDDLKQKNEEKKIEIAQIQTKFNCAEEKIINYEKQILMRTEKLKEKNKQVKLYSEEITKLSERVEEISINSDEILTQNQELSQKCRGLEERLEELRAFQTYVTRIKGDINNKKSEELGKLMESLTKLHSHS